MDAASQCCLVRDWKDFYVPKSLDSEVMPHHFAVPKEVVAFPERSGEGEALTQDGSPVDCAELYATAFNFAAICEKGINQKTFQSASKTHTESIA